MKTAPTPSSIVDVQTDGILPLEWLNRWTGVKASENLLASNLYRVQRDLELMPLVRHASVQRVPPNTLARPGQ